LETATLGRVDGKENRTLSHTTVRTNFIGKWATSLEKDSWNGFSASSLENHKMGNIKKEVPEADHLISNHGSTATRHMQDLKGAIRLIVGEKDTNKVAWNPFILKQELIFKV